MAILNFDANTVAPDAGGFEALPAGWYKVVMEASEMKPTKDGQGSYLECKYKILEGAHANKNVFGRLNLRNNNAQAQEIAYKQLSAICHATGILQVADSAQLHNIPLQIKLKLREARKDLDPQGNVLKEYEASNEINGYKNINEQVGAPAVSGFPGQAPAQFAPPPAAAAFAAPAQQSAPPPQQFAPAQQQQAPQQAPQQQWQAPAVQQPWQAPAQAPQQAPQMQQAPIQQQPAQQAPAWNQQTAQQAPVQQVPAQQAPVQQQAPNPAAQAQAAVPPWMQGQAAA